MFKACKNEIKQIDYIISVHISIIIAISVKADMKDVILSIKSRTSITEFNPIMYINHVKKH